MVHQSDLTTEASRLDGVMNKREAASLIALNIAVHCRQHGIDDTDISPTMIAEAISRMTHETVPGSFAHSAALLRPSDRTVRTEYNRQTECAR